LGLNGEPPVGAEEPGTIYPVRTGKSRISRTTAMADQASYQGNGQIEAIPQLPTTQLERHSALYFAENALSFVVSDSGCCEEM
jgi:hypothetical protein